MPEAVLHPIPRRVDVAREQLRAVGLSLRREGAVAAGALGLLSVVILWDELREGYGGMNMTPELGVPVALVALLVPMAVWKGEGPGGRGYHHAMPVERGPHAVARGVAGLVWTLAATGAWFAWLVAVALASGSRFDGMWGADWRFAAPVAGVVVMYLLGSALTLRAAHPWRWLGGGAAGYVFLKMLAGPDGELWLYRAANEVLRGRYGVMTLLTGRSPVWIHTSLEGRAYEYLSHRPVASVWVMSVWLWLTLALLLFLWSAYRQPER
ncbi:MAG TPA: hypothetical protein VF092_31195 [Longimicrobium sp.]